MSEWTEAEIEKAVLKMKKKAMTDADFRKLCLTDAAAAVKAACGKELPEGVKLKIVENDGAHMTIVLPDMADGEMSEADLDRVAGGGAATGMFCMFSQVYACGDW